MAETSIKISLEVVDKAAQKALSDFTAKADAADKSVGRLSGSTMGMSKSSKYAGDATKRLGDIITDELGGKGSGALGSLAGMFSGPLLLGIGAATAALYGMKKWLDLTLESERNTQIVNTFNAIASAAGLSAQVIEQELAVAVRGMADDEETLLAAGRAINLLGENAGSVADIMELARKATAAYGGDLLENFESISKSLATGNEKALRNYGITINQEEAYKKFAASIGTTADKLNQAGKDQAFFVEAMAESQKKLAGVDEDSAKATVSLQRFKVAVGNATEAFGDAIANSSLWSGSLKFLTTVADDSAKIFAVFGSKNETVADKLKLTQTRIEALTQSMKSFEEINGSNHPRLEAQRTQLELLRKELKTLETQYKATGAASGTGTKDFVGPAKPKPVDNNKFIEEDKTKKKDETDPLGKRLAEEAANAQTQANMKIEILRAQREQELITDQEFFAARQQLVTDTFITESEQLRLAREQNKLTEQQYYAARDQLSNKFAVDQAKRDAEVNKWKLEDEKRLNAAKVKAVESTLGIMAGLTEASSRELFEVGKAAALAQASINTYEAVTKTMSSAPYPFNIPLAAAQGLAGAVQISKIAQMQPKFEDGGIVGGNSFSGDKISARVNSGEMILNRGQQANLFKMVNAGAGSAGLESKLDTLIGLIASKDENIVVNVGGRTVVDALRSEIASGRSFA